MQLPTMLILLCLCALSAGAFRFTARSASTTSISTSTSAPHIHHTHRHHTHHHRHALLMATETAYLSVTEVADRYKLITYGQRPKQTYGLESLDRTCYVAAKEAEVSRVGGIGLELEEIYNYGDGSGIVLVAGMVPGSNADGGQFLAGDALTSVTAVDSKGAELTPPTALTGLNYDRTLSALSRFGDFDLLRFTVQRLRKRGEIVVKVVGPQNEVVTSVTCLGGFDTNLRMALLSTNLKVYDDRTARFDSPFQTGNCGGDGTCGTCVVAVLSGGDLLNDKVLVEDKALRAQVSPPNYRWSCRVKVGPRPEEGGEVTVKLRPQTVVWDYTSGKK